MPEEVVYRGQVSLGSACFRDQLTSIDFRIMIQVRARSGAAGTVTNADTFITRSPDTRIGHCRIGSVGSVNADVIWLVNAAGQSEFGYLEHELAHALGCRHTQTPASVVYNGGHGGDYRGYRLGVSDGMCIVRQLNFQPVILRYFRTQPISSVFVRDFARWPETPTVDRGMTNPCCFRTDSMEPSLSLDLAMVPRTHRRLIYQEPLACLRPRFMRSASSLGRDDDLG